MRYKGLKPFRIKTASRGEMHLQAGQVLAISKDKAIALIEQGRIKPIGRVAHRIYSNILQAHLWVVADEDEGVSLRAQGITEVVYIEEEIKKLIMVSTETLKALHKLKETFPNSIFRDMAGNPEKTL